MPRFMSVFAVLALLLCGIARADAGIVVTVNKSTQRITVEVDGVTRHHWPVSTARWGYRTPNGRYGVQRLERKWFSRKYDWSPMPYSIFFNGGYAIHGSNEISRLGRPASHGCIRLHPGNAAVLFAMVERRRRDTSIIVIGDKPLAPAVSRRERVAPSIKRTELRSRPSSKSFEEIFAPAASPRGELIRQRW